MPLGRTKQTDSLELIVLAVLADEPLYGYAIIKRVAARSEGAMRLTPGVLYPLLHQLEKEKLISATWEAVRSDRGGDEADGEGRRRKWYQLSPAGRRRLAQRIESHRAGVSLIERFLPQAAPEGEGA